MICGILSGSTLPSNRMALLNTYMQMYQMGLIDQQEVLKKTELVDIEGVMERAGQMQQMMAQLQGLQEELKKVKGDLQTATREEVHAKKRLEVEKFSSDLDKISNAALKLGIIIINKKNKLIGTITDGDIRRGLLNGINLSSPLKKIINPNPLIANPKTKKKDIKKLMLQNSVYQIPVVDKNKKIKTN